MVEEDVAEDLELDTHAETAELPAQEAAELPADARKARFNVRFNALVQTNSERLARRIGRSGHLADKDLLLISQALAVPLERVQLWATTQVAEPLDQQQLTQSLISLGLNV